MPVGKVSSYKIHDEVLAPKGTISIDYKGKNPFSIYFKMSGLLQSIFRGRGKNVFETSFKWDITGDPVDFFVEYWFKDWKFDVRTKPEIRVRMHGLQPSDPESPNGICKIEIKALLETTYEFNSLFEKAIGMGFIWLYHRLIYNEVRRRYMQIIKERVEKLEAAIREHYGMPIRSESTAGGAPRLYKTI